MIKHLSARSFRVAISDIPFIIMGRLALNKDSESSVCNVRVPKPLPVAIRHRASEIQSCRPDKLSKFNTQELLAAMIRSLSECGRVLSGTDDGSITLLSSLAVILLALPCSPCSKRIGKGPSGLIVPTNQPAINRNAASLSRFKNSPRTFSEPLRSG